MVTSSRSRATSLLAALSVVFLLATACSDDDGGGGEADGASTTTAAPAEDGATTTTAPADAEPPSESQAASLRSELAGLLVEQVYLTGYVVEEALAGRDGLSSPVAAAAVDEASASATELSDMIGAAYGVAGGTDFLAAWNDHREAIVTYGVERGSVDAIASTRTSILAVLGQLDAEADISAIEFDLETSDANLITTVDELVDEEPGAAADLRAAAEPMADVALALATAITATVVVEGELEAPEVELRSDLSGLIQESALLTGLGLAETVQAGGDSAAPGPAGVLDALAENTDDLADVIVPNDIIASSTFSSLWNSHIDAFEQYATALVDDDAEGLQAAREDLVSFRDELGRLLSARYPGLTEESVAEELVDHVQSLLAFVDASVRESGNLADGVEESSQVQDTPSEAPRLLREAALAARLAARTLARGITTDAPAS